MRFVILRAENLVVIDNAAIEIDCSALPANVAAIVWQDELGKIEYNDRPAMRTDFTDPSPYIPYLNSWMLVAQTPPLQLPQAKKVKADLVDALYNYKRRLPYSYGWIYDANDKAVMYMNSTLLNKLAETEPGGLLSAINGAFASLVDQLNPIYTSINANAYHFDNSMVAVDGWSLSNAQNWGGVTLNPQPKTTGGTGVSGLALHTHPYSGMYGGLAIPIPGPGSAGTYRMSQSSYVTDVTVAFTPETAMVAWQPLNSASIVAISVDDFNDALSGILSRRNTLNNNRRTKQTAINALSTIPAVVAYDVTTGWSF